MSSIPDTQSAGHFESVHLLRGAAALMVLMAHSSRSYMFWDLPWFHKDFLSVGQIGVSIFFVISGFVLPLSLQKGYTILRFPQFLGRRFVRIEPTYLASMVVAITWVWAATRMAPNATPWKFDSGQILAHLLYLVPFTDHKWVNDVYWTLAIEFQYYLFIGLAFPFFRWAANKAFWMAGCLILAFSLVSCLHGHLDAYLKPLLLLRYAPFFGIGILAWLAVCYPAFQQKRIGVYGFLALISIIGFVSGHNVFNLLFSAVTFFLIIHWKPGATGFRHFGTISYSLYVIHPPFVALGHVVAKRMVDGPMHGFLILVPFVTMGVCILAAHVLFKLVEEPSLKLSKRMKQRSMERDKAVSAIEKCSSGTSPQS